MQAHRAEIMACIQAYLEKDKVPGLQMVQAILLYGSVLIGEGLRNLG